VFNAFSKVSLPVLYATKSQGLGGAGEYNGVYSISAARFLSCTVHNLFEVPQCFYLVFFEIRLKSRSVSVLLLEPQCFYFIFCMIRLKVPPCFYLVFHNTFKVPQCFHLVSFQVGQLALVEDDPVARVLSWHMGSDMDCLVTYTTKKVRDLGTKRCLVQKQYSPR